MSETIEDIRYDGWELVIDVTGGGVAECIPRGLSAEVAASRLRHLAIRLDQSVEARAEKETFFSDAKPVEVTGLQGKLSPEVASLETEPTLSQRMRDAGFKSLRVPNEPEEETPVVPPYPNTGHGHVWPRPDGVKARCGGPGMCTQCMHDQAQFYAAQRREKL